MISSQHLLVPLNSKLLFFVAEIWEMGTFLSYAFTTKRVRFGERIWKFRGNSIKEQLIIMLLGCSNYI